MNARTGKLIALGLGVALVAGFLWSQRPHPPLAAESTGKAPEPVSVIDAHPQEIPLLAEVIGTLRSRNHAVIASRLMAQVASVSVTAGARVAAGDLLLTLDAEELEARVAASEASVAVAEQTLEEARREEQRTRSLFEREARTQQELDAAATRLASAGAAHAAATAELAAARSTLSDARLTAPFAGVVLSRSVEPGDMALPGHGLLELYDPSTLRLEASLPARLVARLSVGDALDIVVDSVRGPDGSALAIEGRVDELVPSVDAATRTALVKIALPDIAGALPGMFARALVPAGERLALVVPRGAVVERGQIQQVFTASDDGRNARMHLVRTGRRVGEGIELLTGLSGTQRVVVEGAQALHDGTPIRIRRAGER